ncbi:eCIS core domain-containing protein [Pseudoduganella flava]|uniref:eCIS core domain-containing protein n=1 Tax=Pseudoduganella flava TaxID=871742 RepID=UPI001303AF7A|nr:DUF4157 domain-containing protein [Pseudoduganella flava]
MREVLGRAFGPAIADVGYYQLAQPLAPDVAAVACADSVFFAPGECAPHTAEGLALVLHELAHVLQQRQGARPPSVAGGDVLWCDAGLEAQADAVAAAALRRIATPPAGAAFIAQGPSLTVEQAAGPLAAVAFQPYVKMAINQLATRDSHFRGTSWNLIESHYRLMTDYAAEEPLLTHQLQQLGATQGQLNAALEVFRRWMGLTLGGQVYTAPGVIARKFGLDATALARMVLGRTAELKYYNTYAELATALLGEVRSQPSALFEEALAKAVLRTPWIAQELRTLAQRIVVYWTNVCATLNVTQSAFSSWLGYSPGEENWTFRGSYWQYHCYLTPLSGLKKCTANTIAVNTALLHDMMEFIKKRAGDEHLYRLLQWRDPVTHQDIEIHKRDMRNNLGTVNEQFEVVQAGRQLNYQMQAGPSFTVSQMMALADAADAPASERIALAYAIFAFWNQVYAKACTPIHTYYEVMVAAANYQVPFDARASYRHNTPHQVHPILDDIWLNGGNPPLV